MGSVVAWLSRVGPQEGQRLLIGCALDDGESDDTVPIVGLDWGPGATPLALLLEGGARRLFRQVAGGVVVAGLDVLWLLDLFRSAPSSISIVINLVFAAVLLALLLHPMSRSYQRIWFKKLSRRR